MLHLSLDLLWLLLLLLVIIILGSIYVRIQLYYCCDSFAQLVWNCFQLLGIEMQFSHWFQVSKPFTTIFGRPLSTCIAHRNEQIFKGGCSFWNAVRSTNGRSVPSRGCGQSLRTRMYSTKTDEAKRLRSIMTYVVSTAVVMVGAAYAGVPLYRMFCQVHHHHPSWSTLSSSSSLCNRKPKIFKALLYS